MTFTINDQLSLDQNTIKIKQKIFKLFFFIFLYLFLVIEKFYQIFKKNEFSNKQ